MFEKLLSQLPHNPGLTHQMAFYSRRMREEASIRRMGLIFIGLAFMVQFFAVLSPPELTSASSDPDNNILPNGFTSAANARAHCKQNTRDFEHILRHYGIQCDDISGDPLTITVGARNYYSLGHHPSYASGEKKVTIDGVNLYWRPLSAVALQKTFNVLRVRSSDGTVWYLMFSCGNLVSVGPPSVPVSNGVSGVGTVPSSPAPQQITPTPTPTPTPVTPPPPTPCPYNSSLSADSPLCFQPCEYSPSIPSSDANCKPCDKGSSASDIEACVVISKKAINETAGGTDANGTTAKAGDVITYTIYAENTSKAALPNYSFRENINDVLVYATVVNLYGGQIDTYDNIQWPNETIAAGATASHEITVKVKSPIPQTPIDPENPNLYDLTMTNVYGNTVTIKLPGSPAKVIETTTTSLPNTGPGTSLMIAGAIVVMAGYFYSRSRLLADESAIAVHESSGV